MERLLLLLLFCQVSSSVKHSLKFFVAGSSGVPNFPKVMGVAFVDEMMIGSCDTKTMKLQLKQNWMRQLLKNNPQQLQWYNQECFDHQPSFFKSRLDHFKQRFNQSEGISILQRTIGCEWDDETGEVNGFLQYGYDGEDFISLDMKTLTWITPKQQAVITKLRWDAEEARIKHNTHYITQIFPEYLKMYLAFGKSSLLRTDLPSVSLLQRSPSSPISCHATGFYPNRAVMFWRKDGEEIHEDVDLGEILPNHDGSFQMSADLDLSSVTPEDWSRYECVFRLSGVKDDIITKLDKAAIRTNWEKPANMNIYLYAAMVALALVFITTTGFILYKRKKAPHNSNEVCEKLNPDT
ncbi:major histocompatibility complex class I-related gene protein-like [Plectropomus leopardus]|uniref:major histocompatibility complex class I-related gene protein-like n=1 Tax=Plectropomus leopardus TaxID=160734 RepID=UPI001C4DC30C|nr:major histocompatibility complex class I-related gene protein-like [Plectropomus leopardus]